VGCIVASPRRVSLVRRLALLCVVVKRRFALTCAVASVVAALVGGPLAASTPAAAARKLTAANWDTAEQRLVVHEAVMSEEGSGFAGARPLSAAAESSALAAIATRVGTTPIAFDTGEPLTLTRFDALLVDQLGLGEVAEHVQQVATSAGLAPPSYFGSEVVARYLGLRFTHPPGEQKLALYPWNPITRAEAAHSFAVVLGLVGDASAKQPASGDEGTTEASTDGETTPAPAPAAPPTSWAITAAREALGAFSLPTYTTAQREVLHIAVAKIGMPYVWGGTTDNTADGLEHGGYDCSGFAWRVYKLSGLPWGKQIRGRTAAEQGGEIPKRERIHLQDVVGGDLLFFGSAHFDSTATNANVIHEAIAMSSEWAINSSGQGVYVLPLTSGWLAESFTWARRVL
jgi:cell wall-associated NlpC family hydrolase